MGRSDLLKSRVIIGDGNPHICFAIQVGSRIHVTYRIQHRASQFLNLFYSGRSDVSTA